MAFDGNGNWISNFSAVADRDANIKILASRFDNIFIADIAQSFENCLTKDAQVKPQQAFDANSYKVINVANPTNNYDAVNLQTLDGKDALCVHKAGTEEITGDKTFSGSVVLGSSATATTPSAGDNSTKVATTAWIRTEMPSFPDYANATSLSNSTTTEETYTTTSNGWFVGKVNSSNNMKITIGGLVVYNQPFSNTQTSYPFCYPVKSGTTIKYLSCSDVYFVSCL